MSLTSTRFNPFEKYGPTVESIKTGMEAIVKKVEGADDIMNVVDITKEIKNYEKMLEQLTEVAKNIEGHAIKALLSEVSVPFAAFICSIGNRTSDQSKSFNTLIRKVTRFMQTVADRVTEPYNSELLEEWAPIFKAFLTSNQNSFKENGSLLWKRTFGTVKTPLEWPSGLRAALERIPKKHGIVLPPAEKPQKAFTLDDDDAMDGLLMGSEESDNSFKPPGVKREAKENVPDSQTSFQFSQQGVADDVAEKLLNEKKAKMVEPRTRKATFADTPPRKRAPKLELVDDESCEYVVIPKTPPSTVKSRLTDRQKEKLAEAAEPNTSINYLNEESQSGFQKGKPLKNAFSEIFNTDEDSQSFSNRTETMPNDAEKLPEDASSHSIKNSSKRSRKLFDSPVRALPIASSCRKDEDSNTETEKEKTTTVSEASPKSPLKKISKSMEPNKEVSSSLFDIAKSTTGNNEENEDVALEKLPKIVGDITPQKKRGRAKNIPKQCIGMNPTITRRSSRVSSNIEEFENSSDVLSKSTRSVITSKDDPSSELSCKITEAPESESSMGASIKVLGSNVSSSELPESSCSGMSSLESSETVKSPPKTPRTPSILRVGKRPGDPSSPMTDRKKNRVHFDADFLPKEPSASPLTSRRRPVPEEKNQECAVSSGSTLKCATSVSIFLDDQPLADFTASAFFPSLVNCSQKIDRIFPSLTLYNTLSVASYKRSFQASNIKTVGELAQLPKSTVDELPWLNATKAKNALSLFEKTWKLEQRAAKEVTIVQTNEAPQGEENSESSISNAKLAGIQLADIDNNKTFTEVSLPAVNQHKTNTFTEDNNRNNRDSTHDVFTTLEDSTLNASLFEAEQDCEEKDQNAQDAPEVKITLQETPEASQSPASPMDTDNTSVASSAVSTTAATPKETVAIVSRKNLAPIFLGKTNRIAQTGDIEQQHQAENDLLEDTRQLSQVCLNLITASAQKKLPKDNRSPLMVNINRAATFFKYLVQSHKGDTWDEVEFDIIPNEEISVEQEVKSLMNIHKRFLRRNAQSTAYSLPWRKVLEPISESSCFLEGLYRDRN